MSANKPLTIIILLTAIISLSFWFSSRYPALNAKAAMSGSVTIEDTLTYQAHFHPPRGASMLTRVFYTTLNWSYTNWQGMAFGVTLGACFLALFSYLPRSTSPKRFKNSFQGMLIGTPLGVCVNCVAPIAKGAYEAGRKTETALAIMFSSPTLNIVVLVMLFTLFPFYMAALKLAATLILILVIVPIISGPDAQPQKEIPPIHTSFSTPDSSCGLIKDCTWGQAFWGVLKDFLKNLYYLLIRTVPLMFLAGFLGALFTHLWSLDSLVGSKTSLLTLSVASLMGTFLPLPIAFDLILVNALKVAGLSEGLVTTLLFTLGTFSIYSWIIIYRTFSARLAIQLYVIVCLLGIGVGFSSHYYYEFQHQQWLEKYNQVVSNKNVASTSISSNKNKDKKTQLNPIPPKDPQIEKGQSSFFELKDLTIGFSPHKKRTQAGKLPFTQISGPAMGITYSNQLTPLSFFSPLHHGLGMGAGDFDQDGWTDLIVATNNGFELYKNVEGTRFQIVPYPQKKIEGKHGVNVAMVDWNNDGLLDFFFTSFGQGNYVIPNPVTPDANFKPLQVPNNKAYVTSAFGFSDFNNDGFLDIVNGNYFLGSMTDMPFEEATNHLVTNHYPKFKITDLEGVPGQTHSVLFSDINLDGKQDLLVANDFEVPDNFYLSQAENSFKKILKKDGIIPITTTSTMSIDTGDFNNDLIPDIYLVNIGFSSDLKWYDPLLAIRGKYEAERFCNSGVSLLPPQKCYDLIKLITIKNYPDDLFQRCDRFSDPGFEQECMVLRMFLIATIKKDANLCKRIPESYSMMQKLCLDFFIPNYKDDRYGKILFSGDYKTEIEQQRDFNILLKGTSVNKFIDVSKEMNIGLGEWGWNGKFADLDNDEWQDLFVVNGTSFVHTFTTNKFFHNEKGQGFSEHQKEFGLEDFDHSSSYVYIDIDNDGDLDIISNTFYGPFKIFLNNNTGSNSITFDLIDKAGNHFCVGCKITIHYGPEGTRKQFREIKASGGYHSFDAPIAHFGLGLHDKLTRIEILWSTGGKTIVDRSFPANRHYTLRRLVSKDG